MKTDLEIMEELKANHYIVTNDLNLLEDSHIFYSERNRSVVEIKLKRTTFYEPYLNSILDFISNFNELEILDVSNSEQNKGIIQFNEKFNVFKKLKVLKLSKSIHLSAKVISAYKNLQELECRYCDSWENLIENISASETFEKLNLTLSNIQQLPKCISNFKNLKELNLSDCERLTELPKSIGDLSLLEKLNLHSLKIQQLPESISNLSKLKELDLSGCERLTEIPDNIGDLSSLEKLNLSSSKIQKLPNNISKLSNLKELNLSGCDQLTELPDNIGDLCLLEKLNLSSSKIQKLPNSISNLSNLKELNLSGCDQLTELPDNIGDLCLLEKINLSSSKIQKLPESITRLLKLKELALSNCEQLTELPDNIGDFDLLEKLDLCNLKIQKLPESISNLLKLKELDLSGCEWLTELPEEIGDLCSLEKLSLCDLTIQELPTSLSNLSRLKALDLSSCSQLRDPLYIFGITFDIRRLVISDLSKRTRIDLSHYKRLRDLPKELGDLDFFEDLVEIYKTKFTYLDLSTHKQLRDLPKEKDDIDRFEEMCITNLPLLTDLNLSNCVSLKILPEFIGLLYKLETLNLRGSNFETLPDSVSELIYLKTLNLSKCVQIPININEIKSLELLNLSDAKIDTLSGDLSKLLKLTNLDLSECKKLRKLPDEIGDLSSLKRLTLNRSGIEKLPHTISKLSELTDLDLSYCESLIKLPDEIGDLCSLEKLDLGNLKNIDRLPDSISKLLNLRKLDLSGCEKLTKLPNRIGNIESLEELDLSNTSIKDLDCSSSKIQSLLIQENRYLANFVENKFNFAYIREFSLNGLGIRKIHKIIKTSKYLEDLDGSDNSIKFIPDSILELESIRYINFGKNRIEYISSEICRFLINRKIDFSKAFKNNPLEFPPIEIIEKGNQAILNYLNERERLAETLPQYRVILAGEGGSGKSSLVDVITGRGFDDAKETTKEIRVISEPFEKNNMTVHFWDFGGQEIMHSAHRMFFTEDTFYLIVLDSRKEEKPDEWLRFISTKIKKKKAIIILNKIDMNPNYNLDLKSLRIRYPFIIGLYKVSCQTNEGIEKLKDDLFTAIKANYLTPPVENWIPVQKEIHELRDVKRRHISRDEFNQICKKYNIPKDKNLSDYFHKIGFVFNNLNTRLIVLDTEWLIKGIYPIITNEEVIKNNGKVHLAKDYFNIFRTTEEQDKYSTEDFEDILKLMEENELCFQEELEQYLIPALLPEETPNSVHSKKNILDQLKIYFEYKGYLNPSILYQFISKMHKASPEKLYWRNGIVISDENNLAIIQSDENLRRISISIQGENKKDYFEKEILPKFRDIHKEYILQYEILIDVLTSDNSTSLEVNYDELLYLQKINNDNIYNSFKTKKKYDIEKIFEKSISAMILPKSEESLEELMQIFHKKLDELYLYMDIKEEKHFEINVREWLKVSDIHIFEEENRKRIINAESILHSFNTKKTEDYSMYIAQTCRVIEGELKSKFFINTFEQDNYEDMKAELISKFALYLPSNSAGQYNRKGEENKIMLDALITAFKFYHNNISSINDFRNIDFFSPYRNFNPDSNYQKFIDLLEDIRKEYRNKAAHPDYEIKKFSKEEADVFRNKAKEWFTIWIEGWKK